MPVTTRTRLAKTLGVPVKYIKAKGPKNLLTIYKKCMSKDLPLPPIGMKLKYKNKLYGVPRTRLGKRLYGRVFLEPKPHKNALIAAAKLMKVVEPENLPVPILRQTLTSKMVALGFREPILIMTLKKPKIVVIRKDKKVNFSPKPNTSAFIAVQPSRGGNARNNGNKVPTVIPNKIQINKTTTVIHKSSKKNNNTPNAKRSNNKSPNVKRPNMPRISNNTPNATRPNMPSATRPNMPRTSNNTPSATRPNMPRVSNNPPSTNNTPGRIQAPAPTAPSRTLPPRRKEGGFFGGMFSGWGSGNKEPPVTPESPNVPPAAPEGANTNVNTNALRKRIMGNTGNNRNIRIQKLQAKVAQNKRG